MVSVDTVLCCDNSSTFIVTRILPGVRLLSSYPFRVKQPRRVLNFSTPAAAFCAYRQYTQTLVLIDKNNVSRARSVTPRVHHEEGSRWPYRRLSYFTLPGILLLLHTVHTCILLLLCMVQNIKITNPSRTRHYTLRRKRNILKLNTNALCEIVPSQYTRFACGCHGEIR